MPSCGQGPCQEVAYIADFTAEEKEEFEEVCKVGVRGVLLPSMNLCSMNPQEG